MHQTRKSFKHDPRCKRCGEARYDGACTELMKCCQCGVAHETWAKGCEPYEKEAMILKTMVTEKLPYSQPKKKFHTENKKQLLSTAIKK